MEKISRPLAETQRHEWREEVRQHIEALVAAHRELGLSYDEAVDAAITAFGNSDAIGKSVTRATGSHPHPVFYNVTRFLSVVFSGFIVLGVVAAFYAYYGADEYLIILNRLATAFFMTLPLLGGWILGQSASPKHVGRDLLLVPSISAIVTLPEVMMFSALRHTNWQLDPTEVTMWLPYVMIITWLSFLLSQKSQNIPQRSSQVASGMPPIDAV